jgi:hypothetical protein
MREREAYFWGKEKVGSLKHQPSTSFAITDAFDVIGFGGYSLDPIAMRDTYGDSLLRFTK